MLKSISIVFFMLLVVTIAHGEKSVILPQKSAPLKITLYQAVYQNEFKAGSMSHPDQILHSVVYHNVSGKVVVAYQISLVAFDAFNNLMDKFNGWAIKTLPVDAHDGAEWIQSPYATFSFQIYGTGVAYVNAARFEDGSIWRADLTEVVLELQKFDTDLIRQSRHRNLVLRALHSHG